MKHTQNKSKKLPIILVCIGATLLVAGVIMLALFVGKSLPGIGETGWIEQRSTQSALIAVSCVVLVFGIALTITSVLLFLAKPGNINQNHNNDNCDYCGANIKENDDCHNCGANNND